MARIRVALPFATTPTGKGNLSSNAGDIAYPDGLTPNRSLASIIQVFGTAALSPMTAMAQPYPTQPGCAGDGEPDGVAVEYSSPTQINIVDANITPALTQLTVSNRSGKHTVNVLLQTAAPSVFSLDRSGTGG